MRDQGTDILGAKPVQPQLTTMKAWMQTLEQALERNERDAIYGVFQNAVLDFRAQIV